MSGTAAPGLGKSGGNFLARDIGQVFGVALDDAESPNIYLDRDLGLWPADRRA